MTAPDKVALIMGAQGVIGRDLIGHPATLDDWRIVGLSRRGGALTERITHVAIDLLDAAGIRAKLNELNKIAHLFYAVYQDRPTRAKFVPSNLTMLINTVDAIEAASPRFVHISLVQGYRVYGGHLGPFKTPARETNAHFVPPEFMFDQQTSLEVRQAGKTWTWSAVRPAMVGGFALNNPMNLAVALIMYTSISKELGLPLRFPGKPGTYDHLLKMTDTDLLARATVWAATDPRCANRAFNINDSDLFRWGEMWPRIVRYFDLEVAPPLPLSLDTVMTDKASLW